MRVHRIHSKPLWTWQPYIPLVAFAYIWQQRSMKKRKQVPHFWIVHAIAPAEQKQSTTCLSENEVNSKWRASTWGTYRCHRSCCPSILGILSNLNLHSYRIPSTDDFSTVRSGGLTLEALKSVVLAKFRSLNHVPIWKNERPEVLRGNDLRIYRIYPVGITQREALYSFRFNNDAALEKHIKSKPCAKLEVIFV